VVSTVLWVALNQILAQSNGLIQFVLQSGHDDQNLKQPIVLWITLQSIMAMQFRVLKLLQAKAGARE
jgi:hypothetical protein